MGARRVFWFLAGSALLAACNAVTGLGDLEFTREPTGTGGAGTGGSGGMGGGGGSPPTDVIWAAGFGDDAEDLPAMIAFAPDGDVVLAGSFSGAMELGGATPSSVMLQSDGFVARFDPAGNARFVATFDASSAIDCVADAALTPAGGVIALVASGPAASANCYAANYPGSSLMSRGTFLTGLTRFSLRPFGPDGAAATEIVLCEACSDMSLGPFALAIDPAGNMYVGGAFTGSFTLGGQTVSAIGNESALVLKLDPTGAPLWIQRFGDGGGYAHVTDLVLDAEGKVVITGPFATALSIGQDDHTAAGANDIFVARLDEVTGAPMWSKAFPNAQFGAPPRLAAAADGIVMAGDFINTVNFGGMPLSTQVQDGNSSDVYVVKLTLTGDHVWSRRFGEDPTPLQREQGVTGIAVEPGGNVVVAGAFGSTLDLGTGTLLTSVGLRDGFLLRLGPDGTPLAHRHIPSTDDQSTIGDLVIAVDSQGRTAVAGAFIGSIDVGAGAPLQSLTQAQAYNDGFTVLYSEPFSSP